MMIIYSMSVVLGYSRTFIIPFDYTPISILNHCRKKSEVELLLEQSFVFTKFFLKLIIKQIDETISIN